MANIKSAKKRIKTSEKRAERNKAVRSGVKTSIKKLHTAIESGDKAAAGEALKGAISTIEKAGSKGVYHKDNVSRKVSRLTKAVNKMA
ncbi:MAG: 30S ribosomal protein S20 [Lachnospiraceae bacterium]|nr:30S ribosomal protein S20 [Lachnospiraceae bacterium]